MSEKPEASETRWCPLIGEECHPQCVLLEEVYDSQVNDRIDQDIVAGYIGQSPRTNAGGQPFLVCRFVRLIRAVEEASNRIAGTVALREGKQSEGYPDYAIRVVERDSESYQDEV